MKLVQIQLSAMQQSLVFNERINSNNIIFYIGFIKDNPFNLRLTLNYLKNIPIVNISNFISNIIITLSQRHKFINFSTKVFIFSTNPNYKDFYIQNILIFLQILKIFLIHLSLLIILISIYQQIFHTLEMKKIY